MPTVDLRTVLAIEPLEVVLLSGLRIQARPSISTRAGLTMRITDVTEESVLAFMRAALTPDSYEAFHQAWDADEVTLAEMQPLMEALNKHFSGNRPTPEPNGS